MIWGVLLTFALTFALAAVVVFAVRSASRGATLRLLRADYENVCAEVERLRPLEAKLAAAQATIAAKDDALKQASSAHDEALAGFQEQRQTLTQVSERLNSLGEKTETAATKGRAAAEGSERTERLFLGWTKGISNPQSRGALGELAIERQLTDLGLVKGRDFVSQAPGNDGRRRDLVIRAGEVRVIVDSKWTVDPTIGELGEALRGGDQDDLSTWGKRLRGRAKSLADRHYERGQEKGPRLVLMYVPVEGAYEALNAVDGFSLEKFSRDTGVYVVTPSQMGLAMSLVAELWRDAGREEQLLEIARELAGMGERTAELVEDLDAMGRSIATVVNHFNRIVGRLTNRGGLFQQARAVWSHMGRRFKKELLRGADGEILRLETPRDDAATHAPQWREVEDEGESGAGT
jgi:DNA recombination protein RmuC